jgi:imidazolonepropionase-like amidohydrolase
MKKIIQIGLFILIAIGNIVAQETPKKNIVLFTNVMVFNGTTDELLKRDVLVEGNLIRQISVESLAVVQTDNVTIIDGQGMTLMPGMIDCHAHFNVNGSGLANLEAMRWDEIGARAAAQGQEWLADGFTTVRGMGGSANGLKKTIDAGLLNGPRIYPSGSYISQTSGHGDLTFVSQNYNHSNSNLVNLGITNIVDGPNAVRAAVRRNFADGASQIKIMVGGGISSEKGPLFAPQFTDEEILAAVSEAATRDTYVAVHVYQDAHVKRALELGVKSIEHGQFISEETALLIKEKGAFIAPFTGGITKEAFQHPAYSVPGTPQYIKGNEFQRDSKNFVDIINKVKPKLVMAVDIVFLTGVPARSARDFEKYAFARFFGNLQTLRSLTSVGGELMALTGRNNPYPGKLGVIEEGALADILIVDGNPLEDITVIGANSKYLDAAPREQGIKTIRLIMKDGKIYKNTL